MHTATSEFAGPPLGGFLFGLSTALACLVNAAIFALGAIVMALLPSNPSRAGIAGLGTDLISGLRSLLRHRALRTLCLSVGVVAFVDSAWFSVLVLYARHLLQLGSAGFGLLLAAGAMGSVAGGLVASRLRRQLGQANTLTFAAVAMSAAELALGLAARVPVAALMLALSGGALTILNVLASSLRQRLAPADLLGRVSGAYLFVGFGAAALGASVGGVVASLLGLRAPFLLGAPLLLFLIPPLRRLPADV